MADFIFDSFLEAVGDGSFDMDNDTFKCALYDDASLPTSSTYATYATLDAGETEASGTGYTAGGETMTTINWTQTSGTLKFDADDVQWTSASFSAYWAVIYSTTATGNDLVCLIDFGGQKTVSGGTFTIEFHTNGIFTMAQA